MATFGENLRRLRERAGFKTARALAEALGVAPSMISKLENDQQGLPEAPTLLRLGKALTATVDELLAGVDPDYDMVREQRAPYGVDGDLPVEGDTRRRAIPILLEADLAPGGLSWTAEGAPRFQVDEWGARPSDVRDPRAYLLVIQRDAMEPAYKRGWRAIVAPGLQVADGDLACIHMTAGERFITVVHRAKDQGGYVLESYNPAYPPRFVPDAAVAMIHKVAYIRTLK